MSGSTKGYLSLQDRGCKLAKKLGYYGKCVDCPFKQCLEDTPRALQKMRIATRDADIKHRIIAGETKASLALKYSISKRTIERANGGR